MKPSILGKMGLMFGGGVVALLVMEMFLRLASPQIFEIHPPGMYTADPDVGYVLTPGFEGYVTRSEFRAHFTIGSAGLRGAEPRPYQPNAMRILVLGDSQAWGFGVTDEETFAARLEKILGDRYPDLDIQVLNGGVPGYGTADQLAFFQSRGAMLRPNLVIVQFLSVNDLQENHAPAWTWATVQDGMLVSRRVATHTDDVPYWEQGRRGLKRNSHLARLAFDSAGYLGTRAGLLDQVDALWGEDFTKEDAQLGIDLLIRVAQTARDLEARSLFLYTTGQAQVIQATYERPRSAMVVEQAAQQADVSWIDVAQRLQQRPDRRELYYAKDGHWTPVGHQAIAEILADEIIRLKLIDLETNQEVQAR